MEKFTDISDKVCQSNGLIGSEAAVNKYGVEFIDSETLFFFGTSVHQMHVWPQFKDDELLMLVEQPVDVRIAVARYSSEPKLKELARDSLKDCRPVLSDWVIKEFEL